MAAVVWCQCRDEVIVCWSEWHDCYHRAAWCVHIVQPATLPPYHPSPCLMPTIHVDLQNVFDHSSEEANPLEDPCLSFVLSSMCFMPISGAMHLLK